VRRPLVVLALSAVLLGAGCGQGPSAIPAAARSRASQASGGQPAATGSNSCSAPNSTSLEERDLCNPISIGGCCR